MSWIENIQNDFIITTGDGEEFRPLWLNAVKTKGFNISEFEFPNINGTLVRRTTVKGSRFSLELYFQGEDHLEMAAAFEESSEDPRPWILTHPFYGSINVQPSELTFDNTKFNVSKITGTVIETIIDDNPKTTIKPQDNVALLKEQNDAELVASFDEFALPDDIKWLLDLLNKAIKIGKALKKAKEQAQEYLNKTSKATAAINKIASAPQQAMAAVQNVLNAPASFVANVKDRVGGLSDQFNTLKSSVNGITGRSGKKMFSVQGSSIISAQALASVTPGEAPLSRTEVFEIAEKLLDNYNDFIITLDEFQTENNGGPDSFVPDFQSFIALNQIVTAAVTGLFALSADSRQERSFILEEDSDLINLTHRLYGLDQTDENINELQVNNNFMLNDLLEIRKGTRIFYYV